MNTTSTEGEDDDPIAFALLHAEIGKDDAPQRRWAYPIWGMVLVSLFVAYHAVTLLVHNLPSKGLSQEIHKTYNRVFKGRNYMRAAGSTQSWGMFAPDPHRSNLFMRVVVTDADDKEWDMRHDIYKKRDYPYLFYDRMGKINRRIINSKGYRRNYAAWVCREWERTHDGIAAEEVQFVKLWTRVPPPQKLNAEPLFPVRLFRPDTWSDWKPVMWGFDPNTLHLHERDEQTIRCAVTRAAQLPNVLRRRFGLPEVEAGAYRPVEQRTWKDKKREPRRSRRRTDRSQKSDREKRPEKRAGERPRPRDPGAGDR